MRQHKGIVPRQTFQQAIYMEETIRESDSHRISLLQALVSSRISTNPKISNKFKNRYGQFNNVTIQDIARSLLTMTAVNLLLFSEVISNLQNLKRVVWIGVHIDVLEYMKMSEVRVIFSSHLPFHCRKHSKVCPKIKRLYCFLLIIVSWGVWACYCLKET